MGYTPENNPYIPGDPYSYDLAWMVEEVKKAQAIQGAAEDARDIAIAKAAEAETSALDSEAWAIGTKAGDPVTSDDPQYENNAKYYAQQAASDAQQAATDAETIADQLILIPGLQNDINVLDARVDSFASLPPGSTAGNAELLDIRVGANGFTYDTAGDAVRGQVDQINEEVGNEAIQMIPGYYEHVGTTIIAINSPTANASYSYAQISCSEGDLFTITAAATAGAKPYGFCDSSGNTLDYYYMASGDNATVADMVVRAPANAAYLVINDTSGAVSYKGDLLGRFSQETRARQFDVMNIENVPVSFIMTPGTFSASGVFSNHTKRIASRTYFDTQGFTSFDYDIDSGYKLYAFFYSDTDEDSFVSGASWMTGKGSITPAARFIKIVFSTVGDATVLSPSDISHVDMSMSYTLKDIVVKLNDEYNGANTISESFTPSAQAFQGANKGEKLRIMTYNVAAFDNDTATMISDEQVLNLRKMLGIVNADILCIQEDNQYIDSGNAKASHSHVYLPQYPYKHGSNGGVIHAKQQAVDGGSLNLMFTNGRYMRFATYQITDSIKVLVCCTHPVYNYNNTGGESASSIAARYTQYSEMFDWIDGNITLNDQSSGDPITVPTHTHWIIGLDSNSATATDKTNLQTLAAAHNGILGNGGALGWFLTEFRYDYSIDNIIVSDNIIINNIEALSQWYSRLYSDHVPVYADLTLL